MPETYLQPISSHDLSALLAMMKEYYAFDGLKFQKNSAKDAMEKLLGDRNLGASWFIKNGEQIIGYLVITYGFSLEFHGRYAFVDEFYIREQYRGLGAGKEALRLMEIEAKAFGVKSLHLEVDFKNRHAQEFYRRFGYSDHHRFLMTKNLI